MALKSQFIAWPDLSKYDMRMVIATLPSGDRRLLMVGGDQYPNEVKSLGFTEVNGYWLRKDMNVPINEFVRSVVSVFPKAYRRDMPRSEIMHIVRVANAPTDKEIQTKIDLSKAIPIGFNYKGLEVLEGADGRFIRSEGKTVLSEEKEPPAFFLRAQTDEDLDLCSDGIIQGILKGRVYRVEDIALLGQNIFGEELVDGSEKYEKYHGAIGRSLSRYIEANTASADVTAYSLAMRLHEGLPPVSGEHAEKIVTMPMGIVSQLIVNSSKSKHVLVPSIGNGSFISAVKEGTVHYSDTDGYARHDSTMANLPYGELEEVLDFAGTSISRSDHAEVMRMLDARTAKGKSVFFFQANTREADEDTKKLLAWISARFNIEGFSHLDSHMFGRGGAQNGRFMLVVGNRGAKIFNAEENVEYIYDYERLWEWSNGLILGAEQAAKELEKLREESALQSPYISFSQVSEPKAMIPRNLAGPIREALNRVQEQVGNIDEWVASELAYDVDDLGSYLDAEQVDAVALAIAAMRRGRGFIEADQTGLGKGRVLAAMTRWASINGLKTIFVTDKPKLFSDFYRDLRDTGTDGMIKHATINSGVQIKLDGQVIHKATKKEVIDQMIKSGEIPDDINLVMATYTQFNREDENADNIRPPKIGELKTRWIQSASEGAMLILDEAHLAAGSSSNTGYNIQRAVARSHSVAYSSATYAKHARNFGVYNKVLPEKYRGIDVGEILSVGGDALQEVFSADLASEGVLIRREHDMSDLQILTDIDTSRLARNEMMTDKMANILEGMGLIAGEVDKFVNEKNRLIKASMATVASASGSGRSKNPSAKQVKWRGMNFGAKMYNLQRQFMLALSVDNAADKAIQALQEGRKPVIGIENTMESMIRDALARQEELDMQNEFDEADPFDEPVSNETEESDDDEEPELIMDIPETDTYSDGRRIDGKITFREVIRKMLDRITVVQEVTPNMTHQQIVENENIKKFRASIDLMIDAFPDLAVSPIDQLRDKIEAAGYTFGEYSSRTLGVTEDDDGNQYVRRVTDGSRKSDILDGFNNGAIDVMLLTTSGSTGISAHASHTFKDQRQREFIELQIANDVAIRMQFHGRTNRKGQVCPPIIRSLSVGVPSETRLLSMQNNKLRSLSANTTSNQDNANLSDEAPDVLNVVGNDVARELLIDDPDLTKRLSISGEKLSDEYAKNAGPTYYIDILTSRVGMLITAEQKRIYEELSMRYAQRIKELDEAGNNPLKTKELDYRAKKVHSEVIIPGNPNSHSVFDKDVTLTTITYKEQIQKVTRTELMEMIVNGEERLKNDERYLNSKESRYTFNAPLIKIINERKNDILNDALPLSYKTVQEALSAKDPNVVKNISFRLDHIQNMLSRIKPGTIINWSDYQGKNEGLVTRLSIPKPGKEHVPSEYNIRVKVPGERDREFNFYELRLMLANDTLNFINTDYNPRYLQEIFNKFETHDGDYVEHTSHLLDGNLFLAAQRALKAEMGSSVIYTDENGNRMRGIMLPKHFSYTELLEKMKDHSTTNIGISKYIAEEVLLDPRTNLFVNSYYGTRSSTFSLSKKIEPTGTVFHGHIQQNSPAGSVLLSDVKFTGLTDDLQKTRGKAEVSFKIKPENIGEAIKIIYDSGFSLYVDRSAQNVINEIEANRSTLIQKNPAMKMA